MSYKIKIDDVKSKAANIVAQRLKENDDYCPCKLGKSADNKCMCKEFRDTIMNMKYGNDPNATATCHCGLYVASVDGVLTE